MLNPKRAIIAGTGIAGLLYMSRSKTLLASEAKELSAHLPNAQKPLVTLKSQQLVNYPWTRDFETGKPAEDWELRKVKIRGSLFTHSHLVYRERNGEPGYLVFRALKTANGMQPELVNTGLFESPPVGIMVKLGWISAKNVRNLPEQEVNFVTPVENDTSLPVFFPQIRNPTTSVVYNSEGDDLEYPIEDMGETEVEITGFLRKGETQNFGTGRRRLFRNEQTTFIDLERMAALYVFRNVSAATKYYLEAAVEDPDGTVALENKLIPANLDKPLASIEAEADVTGQRNLNKARTALALVTGFAYFLV